MRYHSGIWIFSLFVSRHHPVKRERGTLDCTLPQRNTSIQTKRPRLHGVAGLSYMSRVSTESRILISKQIRDIMNLNPHSYRINELQGGIACISPSSPNSNCVAKNVTDLSIL